MDTKPNQRLTARHNRNVAPSTGFFTLAFALAVLAVSALTVEGVEVVSEIASAPPPTASTASVERTQPADGAKAEGASNVVVSQAHATAPNSAPSTGKPL
jgi:hypothetical protein